MAYAKTKFSEIICHEIVQTNAKGAMWALLKNQFVKISAYNEIEVQRLLKALKDLNVEHSIKFIKPQDKVINAKGEYEFSLDNFIDDRK